VKGGRKVGGWTRQDRGEWLFRSNLNENGGRGERCFRVPEVGKREKERRGTENPHHLQSWKGSGKTAEGELGKGRKRGARWGGPELSTKSYREGGQEKRLGKRSVTIWGDLGREEKRGWPSGILKRRERGWKGCPVVDHCGGEEPLKEEKGYRDCCSPHFGRGRPPGGKGERGGVRDGQRCHVSLWKGGARG